MNTLRTANLRLLVSIMAACLMAVTGTARAADGENPIGCAQVTYVDDSRAIKASMGFAGAPTRRLDVTIWYPAKNKGSDVAADAPLAKGGPWPLILYSHGTFGRADNATHFVEDLARHGYIVAAANYPLTSSAAFTHIKGPDISDVVEQTRDVRFLITSLLADKTFGPAIDPGHIGTTGHSLGAVTSYFTSFGVQTRDPRIKATAMIGAGDPVQTAFSQDMGLYGTAHADVAVPALFLTAEKDIFARTTGHPFAAYSRLGPPKYEVLIKGGAHVWFRDGNEVPADNKNPDCLFFEKWTPDLRMPGCEERVPLIGPARQQEITRIALRSFFDGYLKDDAASLDRLKDLPARFPDVEMRYEN